MARLDRLAAVKGVAQLGATLGREFAYELLQAVSPVGRGDRAAGAAAVGGGGVAVPAGLPPQATYIFKHALIQDAAYQSLLKSTRQQYHQRIAQVLEAQFPETVETQPELLAQHYTEAGCAAQAVALLAAGRAAGPPALGQPGSGRSTSPGPGAARHAPRDPGAGPAGARLADCPGAGVDGHQGHAAPEVEQTYARARALCAQVGETPQLFPTLRGLWRFYQSRGRSRRRGSWGNSSCGWRSVTADPTHLLEAHDALGADLVLPGRLRRRPDAPGAGDRPHRPDGAARPGAPPWRGAWGAVPGHAANTLWCLGYPAQAVQRSQEALALAQELAHPYSLAVAQHYAACLHHRRREAPAVQAQAEALLTLATAQGFPL